MPNYKTQRPPHEIWINDAGTAKPDLYNAGETLVAVPTSGMGAWTQLLGGDAKPNSDGVTVGGSIEYEPEEPSIDEIYTPRYDPVSAEASLAFTIHKPTPAEIAAVLGNAVSVVDAAATDVIGVSRYKGELSATSTDKAVVYRYREVLTPGGDTVVNQYYFPLCVIVPSYELQGVKAGAPPMLAVRVMVAKHPTLGVYDHDFVTGYAT